MEEKDGTRDLFGDDTFSPPLPANIFKLSVSHTLETKKLNVTNCYDLLCEQLPFTFGPKIEVQFGVGFCRDESSRTDDYQRDCTRRLIHPSSSENNVVYFGHAVQKKEKLNRLLAVQLIISHAKSLTW